MLGFIFLLCGCGFVEETVDDINLTQYAIGKNSVSGYANCVKLAYSEYQYASLVGNYEVLDNSTLVNIDGSLVNLNVNCYGNEVKCGSVNVVGGSVKLDDCSIYGYNFSYDGVVIDK